MYRIKSFSFCESKNPDFPRDSYDPFTLKNMRDEAEFTECKAEFRVEKKIDLHRLAEALQIPRTLKCYQGTVFLVWY